MPDGRLINRRTTKWTFLRYLREKMAGSKFSPF